MSKYRYKASNVFNDISRLILLIKDTKIIKIEGLEVLESEIKKTPISQDKWALSTVLTFKNLNYQDLKIPNKALSVISDVLLQLRVEITEIACLENAIQDSIEQNLSQQPYKRYGVQLLTYGKTKSSSSPNYRMSWHLDKNIRSSNGNDGKGKGFVHPEYHFNMGGHLLTKEESFNYGNVLLVNAPRILHPPMDIILSIDFVLQNFYGIRVSNLLESRQYKHIINRAKERLWRPYFISLANQWESHRFNDLDIQENYGNLLLGQR